MSGNCARTGVRRFWAVIRPACSVKESIAAVQSHTSENLAVAKQQEAFVDRKYGHRGYRDSEKQEKRERKEHRKPPSGGPRSADQFGPRTPRMVPK